MPIAICAKCKKPCPDSFHDFKEICKCVDWKKQEEKMGWKLRYPKT